MTMPACHTRACQMTAQAMLATACSMLVIGCAHATDEASHEASTSRGKIRHTLHSPAEPVGTRIILAHGFLRSPKTMAHLATALAEDGHETACIALRRSRPWSGKHAENARDMIALRESLGWDHVIYAGFSAGALSALLAAAEDAACTKVILLDPVDHGTLGIEAAPNVRAPVLAMLGRPGPGNANRNATPMLDAIPDTRIIEIEDAHHCDFEANPTALCHLITGAPADHARTSAVHASILRDSTSFLKDSHKIHQRQEPTHQSP